MYNQIMPNLSGRELSDLYPTSKTYSERQASRKRIQLAQKPVHVVRNISSLSTATLLGLLCTYIVTRFVLTKSLSSAGAVIFGVCFAFGAAGVASAVVYYFYRVIDSIAMRSIVYVNGLYLILSVVTVMSMYTYSVTASHTSTILAVVAAGSVQFFSSVIATAMMKKY